MINMAGTKFMKLPISVIILTYNEESNILNPEGGSPSERAYNDLIEKIERNDFKNSRSFDTIKSNIFVRKAYNQ